MNEFKSFWNLAPDVSRSGVLNMYVYGRITSSSHWFFGSDTDVVTSTFIKDLRKYSDIQRINVYINSPGGDVFAAAAIYNQLKSHEAEVHAYIDGLGASAAVGLAFGADRVYMSRSALIMIHNPVVGVKGGVQDFEKGIEVLNKVKSTIINIYHAKTGIEVEKLSALMDDESWFTADEALQLGLIDAIVEDKGLEVENKEHGVIVNGVSFDFINTDAMQIDQFVFSNNMSEDKLKAKLKTVRHNQGGNRTMNFEEILNSLSDDEREIFNDHIAQLITNAVADEQKKWDEEKEVLDERITELENANSKPTPPTLSPEEEILNTLSPEARQLFENAMQQAADAQAALLEAQRQEEYAAFKEQLSVYDSLPMQEEQVIALHNLSINDEATFGHIEELLKVANAAMEANFTSIGSDRGTPALNTAFEEINAKIEELRSQNESMDYNEAMRHVANTYPDLYRRYREEE